jgi:hypothetical protein
MASSLAAAIEAKFGLKATLNEGHNGIYEVTINGDVVYTNQGQCSQGLPTDEQIFEEIGKYTDPLPDVDQKINMPSDSNDSTPGEGSSCCSPSGAGLGESGNPDDGCCSPANNVAAKHGRSRVKTILFAIVMLAAVAVGAYSIVRRTDSDNQDPGQAVSSTVSAVSAASVLRGLTPASASPANESANDKDVVFAILPCVHEQHVREVSDQVLPVVEKLQSQGKGVATLTIDPDSREYTQLIELFSAKSFPCVIVAGKGCQSSLLSEDITEERLLSAFVLATTPVSSSSCGISKACYGTQITGSSCCPGN